MKLVAVVQPKTETSSFPNLQTQYVCPDFRVADSASSRSALDRDALMLENLNLVQQVAKQLRMRLPSHVELDELVAAGTLGLLDAAQKYDPAKEIHFASYARFRIRGTILDSLRTADWSPRDLRRKYREIKTAQSELSVALGRAPESSEVAAVLGLELSDFQQLLGELSGLEMGSLHAERSDEQSGDELAQVPAPEAESPFSQCLAAQIREHLVGAIDKLPEKERIVLTLRYYEELSVREIASVLGVVESRVSQIHRTAVERLRGSFSAQKSSAR